MRIADQSFVRVKNSRYRPAVLTLTLLILASVLLTGCTEVANPTATAVVFDPTPAPPGTRALVLAGGSGADLSALVAQPIELPPGDANSGEALHTSLGCAACHSVADDVIVGPGWQGLYARAGDRTELRSRRLPSPIHHQTLEIYRRRIHKRHASIRLPLRPRTCRPSRLRQSQPIGIHRQRCHRQRGTATPTP